MTRHHNGLRDRVSRRVRQLEAEGRVEPRHLPGPVEPFMRRPGDFVISRKAPDGTVRSKESALVVARRRDPGSTYRGSDARWFVFGAGTHR